MSHTPGPWQDRSPASVHAVGAGPHIVWIGSCVRHAEEGDEHISEAEARANARLVAKAPELLRLAEDLILAIDGECEFTMWDDGWQEIYLRARRLTSQEEYTYGNG